jgi:hypothetical protein
MHLFGAVELKIRPDSGAQILAAAASLFTGVSSSPF